MQMEDKVISGFLTGIKDLRAKIRAIYFFGSRVRNDYRPDSDYDLLIVTEKKDRELKDKLYDSVMDVLIETGKYISLKIFSLEQFNYLSSIPTLFMERILKEGVKIG